VHYSLVSTPLTMPKKSTVTPTAATYDRAAYMAAFRARQRKEGVHRVSVILDAREYARLSASAKAAGDKLSPHLKTLALAYSHKQYLVPPDLDETLKSLLAVVRGIGTNINQMARHSNEVRAVLEQNDMFLELKRLNDAMRDFIRKPKQAPSHQP
jgi:Bacterial mobilisation protein (MobC)